VEKNVDELMTLEGHFVERFNYVREHLRPGDERRLLVSGCAVGSELIAAMRYGYREVSGTEVVRRYVEIATRRLARGSGFDVRLYDGLHLPWPDRTFTAIVSAHIIEHTRRPPEYLREHFRVLSEGGLLFLEFPDRYHRRELHTNLPSVEWLPSVARSLVLRGLEICPVVPKQARLYYREVRTELHPISMWQIQLWATVATRGRCRIVHAYHPAPGYTRCILRKGTQ
jgi:SAM-dependent methyltransferase